MSEYKPMFDPDFVEKQRAYAFLWGSAQSASVINPSEAVRDWCKESLAAAEEYAQSEEEKK
jgi:hypothetical protein